jgi:hypothetical protein
MHPPLLCYEESGNELIRFTKPFRPFQAFDLVQKSEEMALGEISSERRWNPSAATRNRILLVCKPLMSFKTENGISINEKPTQTS